MTSLFSSGNQVMRHADRVAGGSGLSESKATKAMWRKSLEMKAKLEEQG